MFMKCLSGRVGEKAQQLRALTALDDQGSVPRNYTAAHHCLQPSFKGICCPLFTSPGIRHTVHIHRCRQNTDTLKKKFKNV